MTREELYQNVESKVYDSKVPYPKESKKSKYYVFDRTKSVEWNDKKLKDYNGQIDEMQRKYRESVEEGCRLFKRDCVEYLCDDLFINRTTASRVFDFAYDQRHASGFYAVLLKLDDCVELLEMVVKKG